MLSLYGQDMEVLRRIYRRRKLLAQYMYYASLRAFKLWGPIRGMFYNVWLFSFLGWQRFTSSSWGPLRLILVGLLGYCYFYLSFDGIYGLFNNPVMSDKGYMGYTVFVSCGILWFTQLYLCVFVKSYRDLLGKYWERVLMLNIVVLVVLLSLFAQVGRAKFGIRVWYPNERFYGAGKSSLEFWDW